MSIKCPHVSRSTEEIGGKKVSTDFPFELTYFNTINDWVEKGLKSVNEALESGQAPVSLSDKQKAAVAMLNESFPATNHTPKPNEKGFISRDEASKTVHPILRPMFSEIFHGSTLTQQVGVKAGGEFAAIDNEDLLDACKALRKIKDNKEKYNTAWIIKRAQAMLAE